jgi:hypothetical protein
MTNNAVKTMHVISLRDAFHVMGGFGMMAALLGAGLACVVDQYAGQRPRMELIAGRLLIAGIGLLGFQLGSALGPSNDEVKV